MDFVKCRSDGAHRSYFNKRIDNDLLVQDHVEDDWIVFGQAAPCSDNLCVEGHQLGEHVFILGHAEAHQDQLAHEGQQIESESLTRLGARYFEDFPTGAGKALGFAEGLEVADAVRLSVFAVFSNALARPLLLHPARMRPI